MLLAYWAHMMTYTWCDFCLCVQVNEGGRQQIHLADSRQCSDRATMTNKRYDQPKGRSSTDSIISISYLVQMFHMQLKATEPVCSDKNNIYCDTEERERGKSAKLQNQILHFTDQRLPLLGNLGHLAAAPCVMKGRHTALATVNASTQHPLLTL